MSDEDEVLDEASAEHPGFQAVAQKIAARQGVPLDRAKAILAAGSRGASAKAKKRNPRLKRVLKATAKGKREASIPPASMRPTGTAMPGGVQQVGSEAYCPACGADQHGVTISEGVVVLQLGGRSTELQASDIDGKVNPIPGESGTRGGKPGQQAGASDNPEGDDYNGAGSDVPAYCYNCGAPLTGRADDAERDTEDMGQTGEEELEQNFHRHVPSGKFGDGPNVSNYGSQFGYGSWDGSLPADQGHSNNLGNSLPSPHPLPNSTPQANMGQPRPAMGSFGASMIGLEQAENICVSAILGKHNLTFREAHVIAEATSEALHRAQDEQMCPAGTWESLFNPDPAWLEYGTSPAPWEVLRSVALRCGRATRRRSALSESTARRLASELRVARLRLEKAYREVSEKHVDTMRRLGGLAPVSEAPAPKACRRVYSTAEAKMRTQAGIEETASQPDLSCLTAQQQAMRSAVGLPSVPTAQPSAQGRELVEVSSAPVRQRLDESTSTVRIIGRANTGDVRNQNGRTYSTALLARQAEAFNVRLREGPILGALDHPGVDGTPQAKDAAVSWERAWMEGPHLMLSGKLLQTRAGKDAAAILAGARRLSLSTRGWGDTDQNGNVQDNYQMSSCDIVDGGSMPGAVAWRA